MYPKVSGLLQPYSCNDQSNNEARKWRSLCLENNNSICEHAHPLRKLKFGLPDVSFHCIRNYRRIVEGNNNKKSFAYQSSHKLLTLTFLSFRHKVMRACTSGQWDCSALRHTFKYLQSNARCQEQSRAACDTCCQIGRQCAHKKVNGAISFWSRDSFTVFML